MPSSGFVRATALIGFIDYVEELGGDPYVLLTQRNIAPARLSDENYQFKYSDFIQLLEDSAKALNEPYFGLRFSTRQELEFLGAIAAVARSAPTVLQGIQEVARYIHHYSPAAFISVEPEGEHINIVLDINLPSHVDKRQIMDLKMGLVISALRSLANKNLRPQRLQYRRASSEETKEYRRFFGCPVSFSQQVNAISFLRRDLCIDMKSADQQLYRLATERIDREIAELGPVLIEQVKALISRLLPTSHCNLAVVAERLCLHERTLQRRLKQQDVHFKLLYDKVRKERAMAFLEMPHMPLSQVAAMLGFQEQSSFNKACKRWWRLSPGNYRKQCQQRAIETK
ncbi:MAG: AraC family transcriptional regulator [Spongiibacteraceae bacterium]